MVVVENNSDLGRALVRFYRIVWNADDPINLYRERIFDEIRRGEISQDEAAGKVLDLIADRPDRVGTTTGAE